MAHQTLTLDLPESLYQRLQHCASQADRSVADEVIDLVTAAMPVDDELSADILAALAPLPSLNDVALWRIARSKMPADAANELEELHWKRQREGLTKPEAARSAELMRLYERTMLLRAEAATLLKRRGHDISVLMPQM